VKKEKEPGQLCCYRQAVDCGREDYRMIKILIADDHAVVRQGVQYILRNEFKEVEFGEALNAEEVLDKVREQTWNLVILDIKMPGKSGLNILEQLKHGHPNLPVFVLSMYPEEQYAMRLLKSGASGYMNKENAPEELVRAVRKILSGGVYISPSLSEKLITEFGTDTGRPLHETLSSREFQVMLMLASGKSLTEIADEIHLSVKTISTHRSHILEKMKMHTNAQLTSYALENHLIEIE
jgi:two-component system invasion response regulator UvrY